jgi:hypothetical protein
MAAIVDLYESLGLLLENRHDRISTAAAEEIRATSQVFCRTIKAAAAGAW